MIGIYIRIKIDGKRTFRAAPTEAEDYQYWLKSSYDHFEYAPTAAQGGEFPD